jgi:hypothetical protein
MEISCPDYGNLVSSYESNSASCKFAVTEKFLLVCVREKGIERGAPASWLSFSAAAVREREGAPERSRLGSGVFSGEICHSFLRGEERMAAHGTPRKEVA